MGMFVKGLAPLESLAKKIDAMDRALAHIGPDAPYRQALEGIRKDLMEDLVTLRNHHHPKLGLRVIEGKNVPEGMRYIPWHAASPTMGLHCADCGTCHNGQSPRA